MTIAGRRVETMLIESNERKGSRQCHSEQCGTPPLDSVSIYLHDSPLRAEIESFITYKFLCAHQAEISDFMPILLKMNLGRRAQAVLGLRPGGTGPMFLEQYLPVPAYQQLARQLKQPVPLRDLIEIGNLALSSRRAGLMLFVVMAMSAVVSEYQWMLFTVTPEILKLILRLGFEPHYLAEADPDCMLNGGKNWGRYYDHQPKVMAGSLEEAARLIRSTPVLNAIAQNYNTQIEAIANILCESRDPIPKVRIT